MPIYEYKCRKCGHQFEVIRPFGAKPPSCPKCRGVVSQVFSGISFVFKGGKPSKKEYYHKSGNNHIPVEQNEQGAWIQKGLKGVSYAKVPKDARVHRKKDTEL